MTREAAVREAPAAPPPAAVALGGVAVLLVVLQGTGGFTVELLGVDLLLAVVGFRVTHALLEGAMAGGTGRLPLGAWYGHQLASRVPLLVVVLAIVLAVAAAGRRDPAGQAGLDVLTGAIPLGNWWELAGRTGLLEPLGPARDWYADRPGTIDPLGLLWLVGLLAQLAVLWPLVLAPLRRLVRARTRRDLLRRLLPVLLLTGYLVWLVGPLRSASGATLAELALGTHVRAAEFLLGAVAATVVVGLRDRPVSRPVAPLLALLGTAVLVGMAVLAVRQPAEWLRSGGPTGAALGGALLLLAAQLPADGPVGSALGRGLPLELGRSAYPLLVLHLPVFWLIQQGVPTVRPAALAVAGTALAWLIGLLLQDGLVRRWRARRQPVAVASLTVLALVTVIAAGVLVHQRVADLPPDLPPDPTWARALAPRPEDRPVVLVLGGSTGGDLAAALAADPGPYAVRDATRPGCGLLVTAVPASTAARVSAHAQLPPAAGPSCAGWQQRWRAELVDYRPVAVLLDLAADAAPTRIPATAPTPCDPGFRTHYRSLVAEAVAVLAAGGSGMPVLVSGSRTRSGGATGAARCFDALVADAVATQSMLVPLDHQALLCPGGVCAEGIEFGRSAHDAAHLGAGERAVLGPWLRATVAAELAPERVAARAQPQGGTCVVVPEGEVDSADC